MQNIPKLKPGTNYRVTHILDSFEGTYKMRCKNICEDTWVYFFIVKGAIKRASLHTDAYLTITPIGGSNVHNFAKNI